MRELNEVYKDRGDKMGVESICRELSVELKEKNFRVKVLLIGNQSSGKSQFINWYAGGPVQATGEQLTTTKFTLIRNVRKNPVVETEIGIMGLKYWPEIEKLKEVENFINHFETKLTVFNSNEMDFVDLIDTPGLSGDIKCEYDENKIMAELCDKSDLVLIFVDEQVVLSNNKTREIISKLDEKYRYKMKYCLTKIDLLNRREIANSSFRLGKSLSDLKINVDKVYCLSIPKPYENEKMTNDMNDLDDIRLMIKSLVDNKISEYMKKVGDDINEIEEEIEKRINDVKKYKEMKFKELMLFILNMIFVQIMYNNK